MYDLCLDKRILQHIDDDVCVCIINYIFIDVAAYGCSDYLHILGKYIISDIYSTSHILHIRRDIAKQSCRIAEVSGEKAKTKIMWKLNFHQQSHSILFPTLYFIEFNC